MKHSRTFLVLESILLVIIILAMAAMVGAFVENSSVANAFNRTSTSIASTNDAITPDFASATAKTWTPTPTKQSAPVDFLKEK